MVRVKIRLREHETHEEAGVGATSYMVGIESVVVRVSLPQRDTMTMATLIKENIEMGLVYSSEVESIIVMVGNMATCRWTWWRRSCKFYILICRQSETVCHNGSTLSISWSEGGPQSPPPQ